jgi:antitoxin ParD1/3/4
MPTRNINLTDHFDLFVSAQIDAGKYRNASEVLRAGLHLLELQTEEETRKLALLRKLAKEGFNQLDQGQGIDLRSRASLESHIRKLGRQSAEKAKLRSRGK